jgi:NADPH-dependent 2,4-dienoyl-CoA reductase/sulfur reductase-like enzyme
MSRAHSHWDVLVVGGGPGGMSAACEAAQAGARVGLLDSQYALGGQIWHGEQSRPESRLARQWFARVQALDITLFTRTTVVAAPGERRLLAETPEGPRIFDWHRLILATGARELFIPFPGWTLPHVMGVGGLQSLVKSGWPIQGKRVVLAGSGPLLLAVAQTAKRAGAHVCCIAEQTPWWRVAGFGPAAAAHTSKLWQGVDIGLSLLGVPYRCAWWPVKAQGEGHLQAVTLSNERKARSMDCDVLACGFGLVPNLKLARLLGCVGAAPFVSVDRCQQTRCPDIYCAGELTGIGGADSAVIEGRIAGLCAAGQGGKAESLAARRLSWTRFQKSMAHAFALRDELRHMPTEDTVICRCEDITYGQLLGHADWQAAKLQTRCGMGSCQGGTCGDSINFLLGWSRASERPPVLATPIKTLMVQGETL